MRTCSQASHEDCQASGENSAGNENEQEETAWKVLIEKANVYCLCCVCKRVIETVVEKIEKGRQKEVVEECNTTLYTIKLRIIFDLVKYCKTEDDKRNYCESFVKTMMKS